MQTKILLHTQQTRCQVTLGAQAIIVYCSISRLHSTLVTFSADVYIQDDLFLSYCVFVSYKINLNILKIIS